MEQNVSRRGFIGTAIGTGAAAAAIGTPAFASKRGSGQQGHGGRGGSVPRDRRGIQLYTMREKMKTQDDARKVLRFLGSVGYTEVETAGHYEWTAQQFKSELRRAGLRAISGHDGPDAAFPAGWEDAYGTTLEYSAELGQKYSGLAWFPPPYTEERYRFLAERLNEAGELARREFGLQFFYHNHDFDFVNKQASGAPLFDILLENTDRRWVKFELDLFWITEGGSSAVEYLSAEPELYFGYHVKDHVWGDRPNELDFEDAGPGMLDFPDLFDAGDGRGLDKHYFIEHDSPWLSHPNDDQAEFKTAKAGIEYLQNVRW